MFELVAAIKFASPERTTELRHRYLTVILDGLRADATKSDLPGPPPAWPELSERWIPASQPASSRASQPAS